MWVNNTEKHHAHTYFMSNRLHRSTLAWKSGKAKGSGPHHCGRPLLSPPLYFPSHSSLSSSLFSLPRAKTSIASPSKLQNSHLRERFICFALHKLALKSCELSSDTLENHFFGLFHSLPKFHSVEISSFHPWCCLEDLLLVKGSWAS